MKRLYTGLLAVLLIFALVMPAAATGVEEPCTAEKVSLLLIPRSGRSLAAQAAVSGLSADDYALTEEGRQLRAAAEQLLDGVLTRATEAAHCCNETARWTAALVGLTVEADRDDIPYLRAAGDLAPAGERFDVYEAATYRALEEDVAASVQPTAPTVNPDFVMNVFEKPAYAGDGMVIAVLDTGFDADARYFVLPEGASPALTGSRLTERLALIGREPADEGQDREKIPFLFHYAAPGESVETLAEHGTRVAALAGALYTEEYNGSAPGAQLLLMKVFDDEGELAAEQDVLSAIDDALLLGTDVINLSLGTPNGEGAGLALAVAAAQSVGVGVVAAAGNAGEVGTNSFFYNRLGQTLYPTAHPDRGALAYPASLPGVIAVGAATGSASGSLALYDAEGLRIPYTDTCDEYFGRDDVPGDRADFASLMGGKAFTYVAVPGVGAAADYAGLDLTGRVALVERGEISFSEKTVHAAAAGAIAVIVYDNDPDTNGALNMQLEDAVLPAIFINIADGRRLAEAGEGTLSFPEADPSSRGMSVRGIADFSSRGMRDDFTFAPSLVALGEDFVGLSTDDYVALLRGSSYAAPQVAGALAALMGELRATQGMSDTASLAAAKALLQNTATPLSDADAGNAPVSVRAQGAGLLDLAAAMDAPLILAGNDGGAITLTGAGETFALSFTAYNRTDEALTVQLKPSLWAEAYGDPLAGEASDAQTEYAQEWLALCGYDRETTYWCVDGTLEALAGVVSLDGEPIGAEGVQFTLDPGQTRALTLQVAIDAEAYAARAATFPNGFMVEGRLAAEAGDSSLTLPFAAFCGDWSAAPLVSPLAYDDAEQLYIGQTISAQLISGHEIVLGQVQSGSFLRDQVQYASALAVFNPYALEAPLMLDLYLQRNVARYTVRVTDEAGAEVYTATGGRLHKTYRENGMVVIERVPLWDGSVTDNARYICPDGAYTITLALYGETGGEQVLTMPVRIDTTAPTLVSAAFHHAEDALLLTLTVTDDAYMSAILVADRHGLLGDGKTFSSDDLLAAGRGATHVYTIDATALYEKYFYVTLVDYAYNATVIRLDREALFAAAGEG